MKTILYNLLCRLAAKLRPDLVTTLSRVDRSDARCLPLHYSDAIDVEMETTKQLRFITANPMQFDPSVVAAARKELKFRADFQEEAAITICTVDQRRSCVATRP